MRSFLWNLMHPKPWSLIWWSWDQRFLRIEVFDRKIVWVGKIHFIGVFAWFDSFHCWFNFGQNGLFRIDNIFAPEIEEFEEIFRIHFLPKQNIKIRFGGKIPQNPLKISLGSDRFKSRSETCGAVLDDARQCPRRNVEQRNLSVRSEDYPSHSQQLFAIPGRFIHGKNFVAFPSQY